MPAAMGAGEEPAPTEPEEALGADEDVADFEPEPEDAPEDASREDTAGQPEGETETGVPGEDAAGKPEAAPEVAAGTPHAQEAPQPPAEATAPAVAPEAPAEAGDTVPAADDSTPEGPEDAPEDEDAPLAAGTDAAPPRRELDQNLKAILQEEVAREMAARVADTEPATTQTQPDPGLTPAPAQSDTRSEPAQEPATGPGDEDLAAIGPAPVEEGDIGVFAAAPAAVAAATDKAARKDLFPDIEEINSTLDSHGPEEDFEEEDEAETQSGFGRGFFAIIFVAALALALYLVAPRLAESIPALQPVLAGYVEAINGARAWLDSLLQGVTDRIDSADQP